MQELFLHRRRDLQDRPAMLYFGPLLSVGHHLRSPYLQQLVVALGLRQVRCSDLPPHLLPLLHSHRRSPIARYWRD